MTRKSPKPKPKKQSRDLKTKPQLKLGKLFYPILGLVVAAIAGVSGYYIYQQATSGAGNMRTVKIQFYQFNQKDKQLACNADNLEVRTYDIKKNLYYGYADATKRTIKCDGKTPEGKRVGRDYKGDASWSSILEYDYNIPRKIGLHIYTVHGFGSRIIPRDYETARTKGYNWQNQGSNCSLKSQPFNAIPSGGIYSLQVELTPSRQC